MFGIEKRCADMIGGSGNVPKASAHDSSSEGSRKPRTYASSREFWKLLENAGTWLVLLEQTRSCWSVLELGLVLLEQVRRFWTVLENKAVQQAWLAL